jgi:hypothetical protein
LTPEHPNFANVKTLSIISSLLIENPDSTSTDKGIEITDKMFFITITDIEELKEIGVRKYSFGNAMSDAIISTIGTKDNSVTYTYYFSTRH